MALIQAGFLLVTSVDSQVTSSPQLDGDQMIESGEGIRGRMDHFEVLRFHGTPNNRVGQGPTETATVAMTLPDMVLLHRRLGKHIESAVAAGLLDLTHFSGEEGVPRER